MMSNQNKNDDDVLADILSMDMSSSWADMMFAKQAESIEPQAVVARIAVGELFKNPTTNNKRNKTSHHHHEERESPSPLVSVIATPPPPSSFYSSATLSATGGNVATSASAGAGAEISTSSSSSSSNSSEVITPQDTSNNTTTSKNSTDNKKKRNRSRTSSYPDAYPLGDSSSSSSAALAVKGRWRTGVPSTLSNKNDNHNNDDEGDDDKQEDEDDDTSFQDGGSRRQNSRGAHVWISSEKHAHPPHPYPHYHSSSCSSSHFITTTTGRLVVPKRLGGRGGIAGGYMAPIGTSSSSSSSSSTLATVSIPNTTTTSTISTEISTVFQPERIDALPADEETQLSEKEAAALIAATLRESEEGAVFLSVNILGVHACMQLLRKTVDTEVNRGGLLTADGARRRTPGGVYFTFLKEIATKEQYKAVFAEQTAIHVANRNAARRRNSFTGGGGSGGLDGGPMRR